MATACAANSSTESTAIDVFAMAQEEERARHLSLPVPIPLDGSASDSPLSTPYSSPRATPPPPNPPFEFPLRHSPSSAPTSFSRPSGRWLRLAAESTDKMQNLGDQPTTSRSPGSRPPGSPALPDFSFNPGARTNTQDGILSPTPRPRSLALPDFSFNPGAVPDLLSPPLSPATPRSIPGRGGHRRYGSEFVGGNIRVGESITVMSTSPTMSDGVCVASSPIRSPPDREWEPRGRHAHRRSAAISSHDLTMILKPPKSEPYRGSSAPASPSDFGENRKPFPGFEVEPTKTAPEAKTTEAPVKQAEHLAESAPVATPQAKSTARTRVGFSDTLEFIPRPISLVSTESASTVRPGHSVSDSLTSVVSLSNSAPAEIEPTDRAASPSSSMRNNFRPSTAGAVLERTPSLHVITPAEGSPRRNSIPSLADLPSAQGSPPTVPRVGHKSPKRWSFFGFDALTSSGSPTRSRLHGSRSWDSVAKPRHEAASASGLHVNTTAGSETQEEGNKSSGKKKRQKKVKSWAGSILTRKSKSRSQKTKSPRRRSLTPPLPRQDADECEDDDVEEVMDPLTAPIVMITKPTTPTADYTPAIPRRHSSEDESPYPVIDLDAALGPFNTPLPFDPAWEEAQRAGTPRKRQLHSAAGMTGFAGPGMHYHRRAESAPEMPPFEAGRLGLPRYGSNSTMDDVFEEEEEEDDSDEKSPTEESTPDASGVSIDGDTKSTSEELATSTPTQESDLGIRKSQESFRSIPERKGSGSSLEVPSFNSRMRIDTSASSLHDETIVEEGPVHQAVDQARIYEAIDPLDTSAPSPRRVITGQDLTPTEQQQFSLPAPSLMPGSPFSTAYSSSFPSPRSPMSYDAQHSSTAPSSITEGNDFRSLLMGEPGPEVVRISTDLPSITSTNSTVTRESNLPGIRPRGMPFHDQRPASFSVTTFGRRRSSLASLSRLINSAHGERSKLSLEVPCDDGSGRSQKSGKARRWSRLKQFWKSKGSNKT